MTIEEQVAALESKVTELTGKLDNFSNNLVKRDEQIDQLLENQKQQNSYIGKLEAQVKQPQKNAPTSNKAYEDFVKNKWKTETVEEGLNLAAQSYDKSHVDTMAQEVHDYCLKNMQDNNVTTDYVMSVFQLLYGRAMGNPEHTIHQLRKNPNVVTPAPRQDNPNPPLHQTLTPPTMRQEGALPGNVPPFEQPKTLKESYTGLEARLREANMSDQ